MCKKRGYNLKLLAGVLKNLANGEPLPAKNRDHALIGDYEGCRECHIASDWLLIYEIEWMCDFLCKQIFWNTY